MVMFISMLIVNNLGMSKVAFANESEEEKITVVTSFYPMYEFVKQVGGDRINVSQLVPDNASPHGYEPSAYNIVAVNNADVFVYSRDTMGHWVESLLNNVDKEEPVIVQASGNGTEQHHNHSEQNLTEAEEESYEAMGVEIIDEIDASIIYYQQGGNTSIAQTIALETGVEVAQLYDLEVAPQDQDVGYIEAMQENLKALKLSIQ